MSNKEKRTNTTKPVMISAAVFTKAAECAYQSNLNLVRFFEDAILEKVLADTEERATKPEVSTEGLV